MKKLLLAITILLNFNTFAVNSEEFTVDNAKGKFASVFLVTGGGVSAFEVVKVYKKIGTFAVENGIANVPASSYENRSWRSHSHVLVVTHDQKNFSLNKFHSDDIQMFTHPKYLLDSEKVLPTKKNLMYRQRKGIHKKEIKNHGEFIF